MYYNKFVSFVCYNHKTFNAEDQITKCLGKKIIDIMILKLLL